MYSYMQPYTFCCKKKMHKRSDEEEIILKKYDLCISRVIILKKLHHIELWRRF